MMRLPPLNALRAFETAARHGSFTGAAAELGVTSAAVGQQVRGLEQHLGIQLFYRGLEGLAPTAEAAAALPQMRRGFDLISQAMATLEQTQVQNRLSVSAPPTFAMKWLVPRLPYFYEEFPQLELRLDTAMRYVDVARGEADLAIRYGRGSYPGLYTERLLEEHVLPVCSPGILGESQAPLGPEDLYAYPLLHVEGETRSPDWPDWRGWGSGYGLDADRLRQGPRFSQSALALSAAVQGQGIALCGITFSIDEIWAGRLTMPFGTERAVKTGYAYDLVFASARADNRALASFRRWIRQQADETAGQIRQCLADQQ